MWPFTPRREPVELVMQHAPVERSRAEIELGEEIYYLDVTLYAHSLDPAERRDWDLIDKVLDERLAVARAMVPVIPGRTS